MWDVKHAKGGARGLLFSRAGIFLEGTLHAAQVALQNKRRQMKTPSSGASGLGGLFLHRQDTAVSLASHGSHSHATDSTASSLTSSGEQKEEQQEHPVQEAALQKRQTAATTASLSAAMARGKEAAISILPKLSIKTMKWTGFSRTISVS